VDLLIATQNKGKLKEYRAIFAALPVTVISLADVALGEMDVEETGDTFLANARLKAAAYAQAAERYTIADDSGLCVNALDGAPGVLSARYAPTQPERNAKLLAALDGLPHDQRQAYFACTLAFHAPDGTHITSTEGRLPGHIATAKSDGEHGFGYDPLFVPEGYNVTLAEMPPAEKNQISHRGRAAQQFRGWLLANSDKFVDV